MTLQVELVSPERILYSGTAEMVIARTVGGVESVLEKAKTLQAEGA
ncbi:MAG TPA: hypothetical protein VFW63_01525 [Acidimicrobiales bacterium]|nr:hypothetical protein [Acidimicrobiales bacterium]